LRFHDIEDELLSRRIYGDFVRPSYEDYCLSSVPSTVLSCLGVDSGRPRVPTEHLEIGAADKVVLFVADGLGYYDALHNSREGGFLRNAASRGSLIPLTTVFPSTTAAALTTLTTGLTPQEHCLPEWFVYMKEIEAVIATLPFSEVGQPGRDALVGRVSPRILFSGRTIHSALRASGVRSLAFVNSSLARTAYSRLAYAGSEVVPYITSSDLMASLRKRLEEAKRPTYFYVYWEKVDTIEHAYAPGTEQSNSEISLLSYLLKKELLDRLSRRAASETLFLMAADHGQLKVSREVTYLNSFAPVARSLKTTSSGKVIPPWGSARDVYLEVEDEKLDAVEAYLSRRLGRDAVVLKTHEAVKAGLFGLGRPKRRFLDRVGNLMILPRRNEVVWYKYRRGARFGAKGHHGGLAPREMLIPLVASRLSALQ